MKTAILGLAAFVISVFAGAVVVFAQTPTTSPSPTISPSPTQTTTPTPTRTVPQGAPATGFGG